jgi:hypothetical protein
MAVYDNVKVKVFIHSGNPGIDTLDSTSNKVLSITHTQLAGDRILTMVVGGA